MEINTPPNQNTIINDKLPKNGFTKMNYFNAAVFLLIVCVGALLFNKKDESEIFSKDGLNIYPANGINVSVIDKDTYEKSKMLLSTIEASNNKILIYDEDLNESRHSYLKINNKEYITVPYNRDSNYKIFDYGVITRDKYDVYVEGVYFLDLLSNTILQLGNEGRPFEQFFRIYNNDNIVTVVFSDEKRYSGDGGYNKDINFAVFTKNGSKRIFAKYIKNSRDLSATSEGFLLNNTLYFKLVFNKRYANYNDERDIEEEVYTMTEFNPDTIEDQKIFRSDFADVAKNRDVTHLTLAQRLEYCDTITDPNSSECKLRTAVYHNDITYCKIFSDISDPKMKMLSNRCYVSMAIKTQNPKLCENLVQENARTEEGIRRKAECQIDAKGQLLRFEPNFCNTFSDLQHKNYCLTKLSVLTLDESICEGLTDPYTYYRSKCLSEVKKQRQRLQ